MKPEEISTDACKKIVVGSELVNEHLKVLEDMVRIDSRSSVSYTHLRAHET